MPMLLLLLPMRQLNEMDTKLRFDCFNDTYQLIYSINGVETIFFQGSLSDCESIYDTRAGLMDRKIRNKTSQLIDMMDKGLLSSEYIAHMCMSYMSEDDVADMMHHNNLNAISA
jgi:hypothetical protein